jgi:hypothetical protein
LRGRFILFGRGKFVGDDFLLVNELVEETRETIGDASIGGDLGLETLELTPMA